LDLALITLIIGLVGTCANVFFMYKMFRKTTDIEKKFTPIVSNVFKSLGVKSKDSKKAKEIEKEILDDVMKNQFPELGLLYDMGILTEERYEQLRENPEAIIMLIQRWLPLVQKLGIKGLTGKQPTKEPAYDL